MDIQKNTTQPWLGKPVVDIVFILLPPFVSLLFIILFPGLFRNNKDLPDNWWVLLILLVDVAHVYSTLYRTYFDRTTYLKQRTLLYLIPVVGFIAGSLLYFAGSMIFWSILAYLAVFHFVRQQYGFMRLYSRKEQVPAWMKRIDTLTIYYATIFPLLFWHLGSARNFNWFVEGDFLHFNASRVLQMATVLYVLLIVAYVAKEIFLIITSRKINAPRIAIITGTLLSWYFGIVYFNGDMAFTLLNVVSHGIPYMALIWIYGKKESGQAIKSRNFRLFFSRYGIVLFLGLIFLLAYIEEGLWDMAVWKEHRSIFRVFHTGSLTISDNALCFIVPLLALPQITHYIIDGFIWKVKRE